ncbi:MAG: hypothetical protein JST35_12335 [Armatimonadetes bacterium]|nr:hypothetical protein [Armatimonadota bacterium]
MNLDLLSSRVPFRGVRPDQVESREPGLWQAAENVRWTPAGLQARAATGSEFLGVPTGCVSLVDAWSGTLYGDPYFVAAFRDTGGRLRVYGVAVSGGFGPSLAWSEWTAASGPDGETRLSGALSPNPDEVTFSPMKLSDGRELLYVSQGEQALAIDVKLATKAWWIRDPELPFGASSPRVRFGWPRCLQVASATPGRTYTLSHGTNFELADTTTAPYTGANTVVRWTVRSGVTAAGQSAEVRFPASLDGQEQLLLVLEGKSADLAQRLAQCKLEIRGAGSTWFTVYDPNSSDPLRRVPVAVQDFDPGTVPRQVWAFSLAHLNLADREIRSLRWTWSGPSPTTTENALILAVATSGTIPGDTRFGISYALAGSGSESPGFTPESSPTTLRLDEIGGPNLVTGSVPAPSLPPTLASLLYDVQIDVANPWPGSGAVSGGRQGIPDAIRIYANSGGGHGFLWQGDFIAAEARRFASPRVVFSTFPLGSATTIEATVDAIDATRALPTALQRAPHPSRQAFQAFGRLFLVAPKVDGAVRSEVWFSADGWGDRFQPLALDRDGQVDLGLGSFASLGSERPIAALASASSNGRSSQVFVWTSRQTFVLGGPAPLNAGASALELATASPYVQVGARSSRLVAEFNGTLVWVDADGELRRLGGGEIANLSQGRFSSLLSDARQIAAQGERLWIATGAGMLVWNARLGELESVDTAAQLPSRLIAARSQVLAGRLTGGWSIWAGGTGGVAVRLRTATLSVPDRQTFLGPVRVWGSGLTGSLELLREYQPGGAVFRSTLTLTGDDTDLEPPSPVSPTPATADQGGNQTNLTLTATLAAGAKVQGIRAELVPIASGEEVVAW